MKTEVTITREIRKSNKGTEYAVLVLEFANGLMPVIVPQWEAAYPALLGIFLDYLGA